jgi:hypothetical protein
MSGGPRARRALPGARPPGPRGDPLGDRERASTSSRRGGERSTRSTSPCSGASTWRTRWSPPGLRWPPGTPSRRWPGRSLAGPGPGRADGTRRSPTRFPVILDYAHTPDALARALETLTAPLPRAAHRRVRGRGRPGPHEAPGWGAVAAAGAGFAIVTSDNPRTEDPDGSWTTSWSGMPPGGSNLDSRHRPERGHRPGPRARRARRRDPPGREGARDLPGGGDRGPGLRRARRDPGNSWPGREGS